jgi:hypothetical protein
MAFRHAPNTVGLMSAFYATPRHGIIACPWVFVIGQGFRRDPFEVERSVSLAALLQCH